MKHWLDKLTDLAAFHGDESIRKRTLPRFARQIDFDELGHTKLTRVHGACVVRSTITLQAA